MLDITNLYAYRIEELAVGIVKADSKRDACNKAKRYFESREHRELFDGELKVCQIPSVIGVLDE